MIDIQNLAGVMKRKEAEFYRFGVDGAAVSAQLRALADKIDAKGAIVLGVLALGEANVDDFAGETLIVTFAAKAPPREQPVMLHDSAMPDKGQ